MCHSVLCYVVNQQFNSKGSDPSALKRPELGSNLFQACVRCVEACISEGLERRRKAGHVEVLVDADAADRNSRALEDLDSEDEEEAASRNGMKPTRPLTLLFVGTANRSVFDFDSGKVSKEELEQLKADSEDYDRFFRWLCNEEPVEMYPEAMVEVDDDGNRKIKLHDQLKASFSPLITCISTQANVTPARNCIFTTAWFLVSAGGERFLDHHLSPWTHRGQRRCRTQKKIEHDVHQRCLKC